VWKYEFQSNLFVQGLGRRGSDILVESKDAPFVGFGVECLVFGVWCLVFGVWCLVFGVECLVLSVWCLVLGVWCLGVGV